MIETIKFYISTFLVLAGLDGVWLGFISRNFYQKHLGYLFAEKVTMWPVYLFYPIYALGVLFFVILPSLEAKSFSMAIMRGALLGFVAYSAYDLTNQATINNWPIVITAADLLWGIVVTTLTSIIIYSIFK